MLSPGGVFSAGSSPHTRGARYVDMAAYRLDRIIPAYAGSTLESVPAEEPCWDHPRIRGEHDPCPLALCATVGSSPHTRGAPLDLHLARDIEGIIPAYAGSTAALASQAHSIADHPRIRGEHLVAPEVDELRPGSSPHTRGALAQIG